MTAVFGYRVFHSFVSAMVLFAHFVRGGRFFYFGFGYWCFHWGRFHRSRFGWGSLRRGNGCRHAHGRK